MKLLKIVVENLNALYGEHVVDFEGALGGAPLILITGPTGAGKSTLLDAVGLALFGRTPRLPSPRSEDPEQDARSVLSRGMGEGRAAVEFSKREPGRAAAATSAAAAAAPLPARYRATWSCRRARKREDGQLQQPVRTLERLDPESGAWEVLASDHRAIHYEAAFDAVLEGLTVEDFQRSMLLAQGEFAAFLKADEDQRVRLLERLTATERFRSIGAGAAEARRTAEAAVAQAAAALESVALMPDEERAALEAQVTETSARAAALRGELERAREDLAWASQLQRLRALVAKQQEAHASALADRAAHEEDFARVGEHARCAPAAEALREHERQARERDATAAELARLTARQVAFSQSLARSDEALAVARAAREAAAGALDAAQEELTRTREVRSRLKQARLELATADRERAVAATQLAEATRVEATWSRDLEAHRARLTEAGVEHDGLAAFRPLVETLSALEVRLGALRAADDGLHLKREQRDAAARAIGRERARLSTASEERTAAAASLARSEANAQQAQNALASALGAAADAAAHRESLRIEASGLRARAQALAEAQGLATETRARTERAAALKAQIEDAARSRAAAAEQRALVAGELQSIESGLAEHRARLDDFRLMLAMAERRAQLRPGQECPLCGSQQHPFVEDARSAALDERTRVRCGELEAELAALERRHAERSDEAGALRASEASAAAAFAERGGQLAAVEREVAETAARLEALVASLGTGSADPDALRAAAAANRAAIERNDETHARFDALEQAHRAAVDACQAARTQQAQTDLRCQKLETEIAGSERQLEQRGEEIASADERLAADGAALGAELRGCGLLPGAEDALEAFSKAMDLGREKVAAVRAVDERCQRLQAEVQKATEQLARARARREAAQSAASEAEGRRAAREADVAAIGAEAQACLAGREPDSVEAELRSAFEQRDRAFEEARGARERAAGELGAVNGRLESERARHEALAAQAGAAEAAFASALAEIGVPDAAALRARLLGPEEHARLTRGCEQFDRAAHAAEQLLGSRRGDLARHEAARPAALAEPADVETLGARVSALDTDLSASEASAAEGRARLADEAAKRERHAEHADAHAKALAELDVWRRLDALIGTREGLQFQRFAQILNLEELIAKANDRLAHLAPRYRLVPAREPNGEPRLGFAVRDAWHGALDRPITTLSGGETFLVSLALALALADYRAVRMPIETLLLDEGFGTLDRETLEVAMNALQALNARGMQVGVISHVEWLKERIEAQVIMAPRGNGRSEVEMVLAGRRVAAG